MGSLNFSVSKWDSFTVSVSFYSHRSMPLVHASLSIFGCRACTSLLIIALLCHVVCLYYSVDIILVTVFSIIVYPHPSTYCYYYLLILLYFIWFFIFYYFIFYFTYIHFRMPIVRRNLSVGSGFHRFHRPYVVWFLAGGSCPSILVFTVLLQNLERVRRHQTFIRFESKSFYPFLKYFPG